MNKVNRLIAVLGGASTILTLAACGALETGGGKSNSRSFHAGYSVARNALEDGNYLTAIRRYDALIEESGPLETRLRLEKAHALLRANRYDEAALQANIVAAAHQDRRRAAALAVVGTSEHRMAQDAMSAGDFGPTTVAHLRRADAALSEMITTAPDLDPLGAMAERRAMARASLKNLGG